MDFFHYLKFRASKIVIFLTIATPFFITIELSVISTLTLLVLNFGIKGQILNKNVMHAYYICGQIIGKILQCKII
ncbi:MAG TPA: hypothetical protein DHU89_07005 [Flavobacteriales bacterium]|nr:hypothetical protein [Flavobacteriales bacterium]